MNAPAAFDRKGVVAFVVLACALAWAIALPVWISPQHLNAPWAILVLTGMMFAPSLATLVVVRFIRPEREARKFLGVRFRAPGARAWPYYVAGWIGPLILVALAVGLSALFGTTALDWRNFSGFHETMAGTPAGQVALEKMPLVQLIQVQLAVLPLAPLLNLVPSLGEELGWRGYLLPKLLPLGQWRALVISGVIWGLWHAPIILLGYNYPGHPVLALPAFVVFCVLVGILLGWLRLASGSIWPPVLAHGAINAAAGILVLFRKAGAPADNLTSGLLGWPGWLLLAAVIALLVASRRLPVKVPKG